MTSAKRVLIIEDDEQQCELLCKLFKRHGLDAECAHEMGEGLMCLRSKAYSCVVLDPGLPDVPARIDAIRQIPDFGCPCVVLTGAEDGQLLREASRLGAHFVLKGSGVELILGEVFKAIEHVEPSPENEERIFAQQRQTNEDVKRVKPRFNGEVSLGHILTMLGMAGALVGMWTQGQVGHADHESRIKALELSQAEFKLTVKQMADTQAQGMRNQDRITFLVEQMSKGKVNQ